MVFIKLGKYLYTICHVFVSSFCPFTFFGTTLQNHKFLTHICPMLKKLQQRWKVNGLNLVLIITTFALGGSLCGYTGRKLLMLTNLEKGFLWFILYILLITLLWPLCVLLISIPLGQFSFFKRYLIKVWGKMSGSSNNSHYKCNIAIFASGAGSNAQQIIHQFSDSALINISLIVCNKPSDKI